MTDEVEGKGGWKQQFRREIIEYWINFVYLAVFFGVFTWYRRLILAQYGISYLHYGIAFIEALILAKVIIVGDALKLGRRFSNRPLIYSTLHKAVVFTIWVGFFNLIERTIGGLFEGKSLEHGLHEISAEGWDTLLARCLVTFVAFIPFFAFRELGRVLGEGKLIVLFFRSTGPASVAPSDDPTL